MTSNSLRPNVPLPAVVLTTIAFLAAVRMPKVSHEARAEDWEGPKLKPVAREEVFEFARKPEFRKIGKDRYEITFASKGKCDVAVAIEDGAGKVVRHLVAGVLGPNAPEPLRPDSLEQTVVWDAKDDRGKYVDEPDRCVARVSLGLNPTLDRVLAWHPKDACANRTIGGLAADKDGVYILVVSSRSQLRMFDHDGNYLRTIIPYPASKIGTKELNIPTRTVEYTGRVVPRLVGWGGLEAFDLVEGPCSIAAASGRIAMVQSGGYGKLHLLRVRNDGTTGGDPLVGALLDSKFGPSRRQMHLALSPDGKWIYITRISRGGDIGDAYRDGWPRYWHTVFRVPWEKGAESEAVLSGNSFVGEVGRDAKAGTGEGDDDRRLNKPKGIACDSQGRLYVCDTGNNRVQVYATDGAEGKVIKTIKVDAPQEIAVHHATGEIYVLSFKCGDSGIVNPGTEFNILRFGPADSPTLKQTYKLTAGRAHGGERGNEFMPLMCLDSWTEPPKLWLQMRRGVIQIFADRGDKLELLNDFEKDIVASGIRPYMQGDGRHNTLAADPVRGHLYYRMASARIDDTGGPGKLTHLKFPCGWQEMECGLDGYLYVRNLTYLARFDPGKAVERENVVEFPFEAEVPFDYGEEQRLPWQARPLRGVIKIEALPGANGFDNGIGVAPNGDVAAYMKNYRTAEAGILDNLVKEGGYIDGNELAALKKQIANMFFRPKIFPGRFANAAELIMRWNKGGEMTGEDLVPAMPNPSCGVRLDRYGNIYVGIGANMIMEDGKPHSGGTVAKFPHWGGKVYGMGDLAKLKERPARPPEMRSYGWGDIWTKNSYWLYPGFDSMHIVGGGQYSCLCASCRFDIDLYGRCFVPKAYQFTTGVVDTNGNRICEVGRYGNADDGKGGANSPIEIALGYCAYVAVHSDKWLYLCDDGNNRILRVKLGYKAEERAGLK